MRQATFLFAVTSAFWSSVLLWLAWPPDGFTALVFIAFVPLFLLQQSDEYSFRTKTGLTLLSFFLFHTLAGNWMYVSTFAGTLLTHLIYSIAFTIPFTVLQGSRGKKSGFHFLYFISAWLSMEYIITRWDLAWPWFVPGNVFSDKPSWIQWYSFTGVSGGSIWIFLINYLISSFIQEYITPKNRRKRMQLSMFFTLAIVLPVLVSLYLRTVKLNSSQPLTVGIVQPNIDPLTEKFGNLSEETQIQTALSLLDSIYTNPPDLLIFPETFLVQSIEESFLQHSPSVNLLHDPFPNLPILTGAFTTITQGNHTTLFNSMILIETDSIKVYHKSKLLPLVEKQPFAWLLKPFRNYIERKGGYFGSYGSSNGRNLFTFKNGTTAKPLICFESVFGAYAARSEANQKSGFLVVITNDGWWKNESGYRQHLAYARLRCIENQQWMVRCANTGVSAILNPRGEIVHQTSYNTRVYLEGKIDSNQKNPTFYARFGDWLNVGGMLTFVVLSGLLVVKKRRRKQDLMRK